MILTHAQKVFLKFVAKSQLYVFIGVIVAAIGGADMVSPEINRIGTLVLFLGSEAVAIGYMVKLNRQFDIWTSKHDHESSDE